MNNFRRFQKLGAGLCLLTAFSPNAMAETDSERIDRLERMLQEISRELEATRRQSEAANEKAETATQAADAAIEASESASKAGEILDKVSIGGYGELHYNNLDADDSSRDQEEIDFHRFVLFFGYEFAENLRFFSEIEFEHSLTQDTDDGSSPGAVELEQAYIQYDFNQNTSVLGGQFLPPLGILNETHEPPTFYGVERNDVEGIIIPSTYRVGGAQLIQRFGKGFEAKLSVHEGLAIPTTGSSAFRVRSGRQSTAEAIAKDFAGSLNLEWRGIPGVEVGGSFQYESDATQDNNDGLDEGIFWEAHTDIQKGPFGFRALYARWNFDGDAVEAADDDEQYGWYVEPSFRPTQFRQVGFYARYEDLEGARDQDEFDQWEVGLNYWVHPDVVLKFDYRDRNHDLSSESGRDFNGFDLGIGYQF